MTRKLTPEDEELLRAPITQTSQSRTVGLILLTIFIAIMLVLASCTTERVLGIGDEPGPDCEWTITASTPAVITLDDFLRCADTQIVVNAEIGP